MDDFNEYNCVEKWKLNELSEIVGQFDEKLADSVNAQKIVRERNYKNIVLDTAGKSIVTMREVICLCANGYPDGALALARNLYEQFVILSFLEMHSSDVDFQNYIEDYFRDAIIINCKALKYEADFFENKLEIKNLNEKVENEKEAAHKKVRGQYWWTGKAKFQDVVESIGQVDSRPEIKRLLARLQFVYKRACLSLHASCLGNSMRIGTENELQCIDTRERDNGQELPLYFAIMSFIMVVKVTCREFYITENSIINELGVLASFYYKATQ